MVALVRRMWLFMAVSALLNLAALALVGHFWRPLPPVAPPRAPKLLLLTLLPPMQMVPLSPPPNPVLPPPPKPTRPPPKMLTATPLPPTRRPNPRIAEAASGGGGGTPRPKPRPMPASRLHLLAPTTPQTGVPQATTTTEGEEASDEPVSSDGTTPAVTPAPPDAPSAPGKSSSLTPGPTVADAKVPATTDSHGAGEGSGDGDGKGADAGTGNGVGAGAGAGPFGVSGNGGGGKGPRHVVYVLDISGSMDMRVNRWNGERRIDKARDELQTQLESLSPAESFSIVAFSDDVRPFRESLVPAAPKTIRDAEKFLSRLRPDGDTDLEGALVEALAMPGVNVIFVITDGVPNTEDDDYSTPAEFVALADRLRLANTARVPIYTIGLLGRNPNDTDQSAEATSLLKLIAADSGGTFQAVALDDAPPGSSGNEGAAGPEKGHG